MEYNVVVTRRAKNDISGISAYIADELYSPEAALKLLDEIDSQVISLKHMPKRFALVPDERLALLGIRSIPIKNYLIFYNVDDIAKKVNIIRVLYFRRNWANMI